MISNLSCRLYDSSICRSCELLNLPYEEQLIQKSSSVAPIAAKFNAQLLPIVASPKQFGSRIKAKMVAFDAAGTLSFGVTDNSQKTTLLEDCPLHHPKLNDILRAVRNSLRLSKVTPYDITRRCGELKHVIVRYSEAGDEALLRFICRSKTEIDKLRRAAHQSQEACPEIKVVSLNIQPKPAAILEGEEDILLTDARFICDWIAGKKLFFGARSFTQVNPQVAEQLYLAAKSAMEVRRPNKLLDLFCGVGAFSLIGAEAVECAIGIELSVEAIEAARLGLEANNPHSNISFEACDCLEWLRKAPGEVDAVVANPPRRGLGGEVIAQIIRREPSLIIYSSCNPQTLDRDLADLGGAYKVISMQPFDMFPLTRHLEVLAVLNRRA